MPTITLDPLDGTGPLSVRWQANTGAHLMPGAMGLELAPRSLKTRARIVGDGLDIDRVLVGARDITLPLFVQGSDRAAFLVRRRRLQAIMASRSGVRVTHVEDDGESMWLQGYYVGGMEGDGGTGRLGPNWSLYAPTLRCGQPFWSMAEQSEPWRLGAAGSWFPFPPLVLRGSIITARRNVVNPGDVDSWPRWTVTGPGDRLDIKHWGTGRLITFNRVIGAGEVVVIDTRPGSRSVTNGSGVNLMPFVSSDPEFWPIQGGTNDIELTMPSAGDASDVTLTYVPLRESV